MKRGVAEPYARTILATIHPEQPVLAQLEWGDQQVRQSGGKILNPAGFFVSLVSGNVMPPPNFETAAQRNEREEKLRAEEEARRAQQDLETEYEWYCAQEIDRYVKSLDPAEVDAVRQVRWQENQGRYQNQWLIDDFTERETRRELGKRAPLMTLEEFKASSDRHPELPLKPVAEPVASDDFGLEPDVLPIETAIPEPAIEKPAEVTGDQKTRGAVVEESSTVAAALNPRESVVELAAELREPWDTNGTDIAPPHAARGATRAENTGEHSGLTNWSYLLS